MYIGKIKISNSWEKLETLIQQQIEGQSGFEFASGTNYQLQSEGNYGARLCDYSAEPTEAQDGERIIGTQTALYEKDNDSDLYVKTEANVPEGNVWLKISTVGK